MNFELLGPASTPPRVFYSLCVLTCNHELTQEVGIFKRRFESKLTSRCKHTHKKATFVSIFVRDKKVSNSHRSSIHNYHHGIEGSLSDGVP